MQGHLCSLLRPLLRKQACCPVRSVVVILILLACLDVVVTPADSKGWEMVGVIVVPGWEQQPAPTLEKSNSPTSAEG
jgi:hypothetical protein